MKGKQAPINGMQFCSNTKPDHRRRRPTVQIDCADCTDCADGVSAVDTAPTAPTALAAAL